MMIVMLRYELVTISSIPELWLITIRFLRFGYLNALFLCKLKEFVTNIAHKLLLESFILVRRALVSKRCSIVSKVWFQIYVMILVDRCVASTLF